jgi:ATPase subunit of ABC transporter with duplicated ATPase domains
MVILQNISYAHADKQVLFDAIHLTVNAHEKIALVGNNGSGKSTLLKLIAREVHPSGGQLAVDAAPYYVPQIVGQYDQLTIAQALRVDAKVHALHAILNGDAAKENFDALNDDWTIEERCYAALHEWQLHTVELSRTLGTLSGGEKMKVFLAGITLNEPELVLLDEPSNHLDAEARGLLYAFIRSSTGTLIVVSHDRAVLNLCNSICELDHRGLTVYGGNYDFYAEQKQIEREAMSADIHSKEKAIRKAKEKKRETLGRQQKLNARGKDKKKKEGVARIMINTLRNNAENSTARLKGAHNEKIDALQEELKQLQSALPAAGKIKFGLSNSALHKGKVLFRAERVNFNFHGQPLWEEDVTCEIASGDRIALKGANGSGKTTLIKLIAGTLEPHTGSVYRAGTNAVYIDQEYSLLDPQLGVYEQAQRFNTGALEPHVINTRLTRFLFSKEDWSKPCAALSGGERMRLLLCGLTISTHAPDMILLDEPTNNLDLQSAEILTAAIRQYEGTLVVVSHEEKLLKDWNVKITAHTVLNRNRAD